jgi:hypothetical protein
MDENKEKIIQSHTTQPYERLKRKKLERKN